MPLRAPRIISHAAMSTMTSRAVAEYSHTNVAMHHRYDARFWLIRAEMGRHDTN